MASFQFIHCADLGLVRRAGNLTIERQVAFVLAAGDLYDGDWQDRRAGQFLVTQIGHLSRAGIPFIDLMAAATGPHPVEKPSGVASHSPARDCGDRE